MVQELFQTSWRLDGVDLSEYPLGNDAMLNLKFQKPAGLGFLQGGPLRMHSGRRPPAACFPSGRSAEQTAMHAFGIGRGLVGHVRENPETLPEKAWHRLQSGTGKGYQCGFFLSCNDLIYIYIY